MVHWNYIITRLALAAAFLAFLHFGLDPLLRWSAVQSGQAAVGAKVEVGRLRANLGQSSVYLQDVAIANPQQGLKNLLQCEHALLQLDLSALLKRRFVVRQGRVTGLVVDGDRQSSGLLPGATDSTSSLVDTQKLMTMGAEWWDDFAGRLKTDVEQELESVRVAEDLMQRWPKEYALLEQRVEAGKQRTAQLRAAYETIRQQPLQDLSFYRQRLSDLESVRQEIQQARAELDRLRQAASTDKERVAAAKQHDVAVIREKLQFDKIDPQQLSDYLLGHEVLARIESATKWLQRGRSLLAYTGAKPKLNRDQGRGVFVPFGPSAQQPAFLIQLLSLEGRGQFGDQPFEFAGTASDLTNEPRRHKRPAVVQLSCRGATDARIEAVLDHTGDVRRERFVMSCPRFESPRRVLGQESGLALEMAPGTAHVWLQMAFANDELEGRLIWKQDAVQLTPRGIETVQGINLREPLQQAASEVHSLEAAVDLTGQLTKPRFKLHSNLGTQLSQGLQVALQQELQRRAAALSARAEQKVQASLAQFDRLVADKETELLAKLQLNDSDLERLKQELRDRFGVPGKVLGQRDAVLQRGLESAKTLSPFNRQSQR